MKANSGNSRRRPSGKRGQGSSEEPANRTGSTSGRGAGEEETAAGPRKRSHALRIIGGELRGRPIRWSGASDVTRPMKDNIREALFNLAGGWLKGRHVFDLFAGSGAIGIEALSRGARAATFIERHFPTADTIRGNLKDLGIADRGDVISSDTFFWTRRFSSAELTPEDQRPEGPWAVFCSPPYDLFLTRTGELLDIIRFFHKAAPPESVIVVESDSRFDWKQLPHPEEWRVKQYTPATIAIYRPTGDNAPDPQPSNGS